MTEPAALLLLGAIAVALAWRLAREAGQRRQLLRWLEHPDAPVPEGSGAWGDVFSRLQQQRKDERRRYDEVGRALEHFRLATQALPDGVILLDDVGHIAWMNAAAADHFGLDPGRDLGTLVGQLIRQGEFHSYLSAFRGRTADGEPLQLKISGIRGTRVLSILLIPFADTGILLLSRDVTELAKTEVIRRDFVANVSHELRTPLTVISGFLEQFAADAPPTGETARRFLALMSDQAGRMNRLVADLLTLSRLENDSQPPRGDVVDVPAMIESLLAEARALSAGRHALAGANVMPSGLLGSPEELRSAFGNLLSNAVRYTPAGGTITIAWTAGDSGPEFSVADTGIGIPREHLPRLTERFYRIDKGRSAETGGTGLGLAIVKHVLLRHQARLEIESDPGKGSRFVACFPAARVATLAATQRAAESGIRDISPCA